MSRNADFIWKCQTENLRGARPNGSRRKHLRADGTGCFSITSCRPIREVISTFWSAKAEQKARGTRTEACRRVGMWAESGVQALQEKKDLQVQINSERVG